MKNKVVIIGCGNVGMSYAYALLNQKTYVNELVLIDLNQERILGEVMDLNHGLAFAPSKIDIHVGTYADCRDAKIVMIAAGVNQKPGETRIDLIQNNSKVFQSIVSEVLKSGFSGIFLVATNPVDAMTYLTYRYSDFPVGKVIGSGTTLDTARLRYLIGEKLNIDIKNVHAYVIGEHGDSEFVPWSNANIGLQSIYDFLDQGTLDEICEQVKKAAYEIIHSKGATYYGIGMCLVRITNAILGDEKSILTVSSYDPVNRIFVGGPAVLHKDGVRERVYVKLNEEESNRLQHSIDILKEVVDSVDH